MDICSRHFKHLIHNHHHHRNHCSANILRDLKDPGSNPRPIQKKVTYKQKQQADKFHVVCIEETHLNPKTSMPIKTLRPFQARQQSTQEISPDVAFNTNDSAVKLVG